MADTEGEATDVVCVQGLSSLYSTEFHVKFSRSAMLINLFGSSNKSEEDLQVRVSCNGHFCVGVLAMMNYSSRFVEFIDIDGSLTNSPSSEILRELGLLRGRNTLLFECRAFDLRAECSVYLWSANDKIVVVDIDGTLTKSDVRGYVETVYLGRYDYVHEGAVSFFSNLEHAFGVRLLFLTSRPMHHFADTRAFLHLVHNRRGERLPGGPLFANKETVMRAIYRELWAKTTAQFKGSVLVDVMSVFICAGCTESPFCLGVGNKETDAIAYQMAGVKPARILLVQKNSEIRVTFRPYFDHSIGERDSTRAEEMEGGGVASRDLIFSTYTDPSLMDYVYHQLAMGGLELQNDSSLNRCNHVSLIRSRSFDVQCNGLDEAVGPTGRGESSVLTSSEAGNSPDSLCLSTPSQTGTIDPSLPLLSPQETPSVSSLTSCPTATNRDGHRPPDGKLVGRLAEDPLPLPPTSQATRLKKNKSEEVRHTTMRDDQQGHSLKSTDFFNPSESADI